MMTNGGDINENEAFPQVCSVSPERVNAASTSYEAENGTMSGTANSVTCTACSGGFKVRHIGGSSTNYVTQNVNVIRNG